MRDNLIVFPATTKYLDEARVLLRSLVRNMPDVPVHIMTRRGEADCLKVEFPEVVEEVDRLAKGEVSQPFAMGNDFYIVKLGNRRKLEPQTLEEVREDVVVKLKNRKFSSSRREYLEKVRNQSEISINKKAWKKLSKELQNKTRSSKKNW